MTVNLDDIPTPISDANGFTHLGDTGDVVPTDDLSDMEYVEVKTARDLERKLHIARTALQEIAEQNEYLTVNIAQHGLKLSKP